MRPPIPKSPKKRRLRFAIGSALLVASPVSSIACGPEVEPVHVNTRPEPMINPAEPTSATAVDLDERTIDEPVDPRTDVADEPEDSTTGVGTAPPEPETNLRPPAPQPRREREVPSPNANPVLWDE